MAPMWKKLGLVWLFMALSAARAVQAAPAGPVCSPEPMYDTDCRMSARDRFQRVQWLDQKLLQPAKEDLLKPALTAYSDYKEYVDAMNSGYIASDAFFILGTTLLTFGDGGEFIGALKTANWVKATTIGVLDTLLITRTIYTNKDFKEKVMAATGKIDLRSREDMRALADLSTQQLIDESEGAKILLSGENCAGGKCPSVLNDRFGKTYRDLTAWYHDETDGYEEPTRWMEWWTHARGNHAAQYPLPYSANLVLLFSMQVTYLETIKQILIEDGIRCRDLAREKALLGAY